MPEFPKLDRLREYQRAPAQRLLSIVRSQGFALDASDCGCGKTYMTAWAASILKWAALVIAPKIARSPWLRAAKHFDDSFSFCNYELIRCGNTPFGKWDSYKPGTEYFKCQVCQCVNPEHACPHHPQGIHCLEIKRRAPSYGNFVFHKAIKLLIFDEAHRVNGLDSLNAELMIAAKRQRIPIMALSATPAHSPINMRALGFAAGLHNDKTEEAIKIPGRILPVRGKPSFNQWLREYKCWPDARFRGLKWWAGAEEQKKIMLDIRNQIIPARGIRITTDMVPGFPKRVILPELYTLDEPEKINGCYQQMAGAIDALKMKAAGDKNPTSVLTSTLRERQTVELLKVPVATELAEDDKAKGMSVVFFVNFRQTIDELLKRFPGAGVIDGSDESKKHRDKWIDEFQANTRSEMIVNCQAGGVSLSLHDLLGIARSGIVFPGWSAEEFRQLLGRLHRDGGLSTAFYRVLFAADTIEEQVYKSLVGKLNCLDSLVDGDLMPENLRIK